MFSNTKCFNYYSETIHFSLELKKSQRLSLKELEGGDMQMQGKHHWSAGVAMVIMQPIAERPVPPRPRGSR